MRVGPSATEAQPRIWRPGDDPGDRTFVTLFDDTPLELDLGGAFGPIVVAFETWGTLSPAADNAVLILHALSGDSHVVGPAGPGHPTPGWWETVVGPGKPIDTDRWFVVASNVLGGCQGTTGPSSLAHDGRPWGSRFPAVTLRDQVAVEAALADHLGVDRFAGVVGASMGGMRALEWAVSRPDRVARVIPVACGAASSADQIALSAMQIRAISSDPEFHGGDYYDGPGPLRGLALARFIGHYSYRSEAELQARFGRQAQDGEAPLAGGRYAVESYLDHQGDKLVRRFDANTYLLFSRAMDHHDVGRDRGGAAAALAGVTAAATVVAVDSDRLYPPYQQQELASLLPGRPEVKVVTSLFGHDGFLIETEQVGKIIAEALEQP
ncbi:MAG TPA: homoserine O-acetyltransferase [Acidimicrobiales bacterium]|nr:homoserine O-acetyltransferase [Acidimicrobiales bacterium]